MNAKNLIGIPVACLSGFLGGILASHDRVEASSPSVVRASRFELVNAAGVAVAYWEVDSRNDVRLRFLAPRQGAALDLGIMADGQPFLRMCGRDGKNRIALELNGADKPLLIMGDERWESRVILGFDSPDFPDPTQDIWSLRFHTFGSERTVAGIGTMQHGDRPVKGILTIWGRPAIVSP